MIAAERRDLADLIESLTAEQLDTPSLCQAWTVKQVAGHLVAAVAAQRRLFVPLMVRTGFNIHKANALLAREIAGRPAAELAAALRDHAQPVGRPPPIVGYDGQLTDLHVHGQDMRRPLGVPHHLRPDGLRVSLDFLVSRRAVGFVAKRRLAGLRFLATDLDWAWGDGPVVQGAAEAVMLALTGRPIVLAELAGDGLTMLRDRLTR
jgi:uncharacterized protein (TIGR03083 family)